MADVHFDDATQRYYVFENGSYTWLPQGLEGGQMTQKLDYAKRAKYLATQFAGVAKELRDLVEVWDDRFYGPGGSDAIADGDVEIEGVTADQLYEFVLFCNNVKALLDNGAVSTNNWSSIVNKLRTL